MCKCNLPMQLHIRGEQQKEDYNEQALACQGKGVFQAETSQHHGVSAAALAALPDLHVAGVRADDHLPLHSDGRRGDRLHGLQSLPRPVGQRMGGTGALQALPVLARLHDLLDEHPETERVRPSVGIPGADPAGVPAQPHTQLQDQAEGSAGAVHAPFRSSFSAVSSASFSRRPAW